MMLTFYGIAPELEHTFNPQWPLGKRRVKGPSISRWNTQVGDVDNFYPLTSWVRGSM